MNWYVKNWIARICCIIVCVLITDGIYRSAIGEPSPLVATGCGFVAGVIAFLLFPRKSSQGE